MLSVGHGSLVLFPLCSKAHVSWKINYSVLTAREMIEQARYYYYSKAEFYSAGVHLDNWLRLLNDILCAILVHDDHEPSNRPLL